MKFELNPDFEVVVLAPSGIDGEAAVSVLVNSGINAVTYQSLDEVCARLARPAGVVLLAEEALNSENIESLRLRLIEQETWSNIPFILMTSQTERIFSTERIMEVFTSSGAISILERPFRILTLVSAVKVALSMRQRQYQVRDLLNQQNVAVQQRDEFLSIASHELKTPMTTLKLQVQLRKRLLNRGDLSVFSNEKVISLINIAETQIDRLTRLVDDMLDISRIVNGKLTLNLERVEFSQLVTEVYNNFANEFETTGCSVHFNLTTDAYILCDRYRMEQVIANLFSNSIKYGKGKPVYINLSSEEGKLVFKVKDHGIGIDPSNQERIFLRFERAVDSDGISGLGLGLYISKQILDMHKGNIMVDSALGQGSTFIVQLPLSLEENLSL